ncbi:general odorant-binding protein 69a-like [Bacillus rossius redtenbacheri]|uniref:general odorant-binding protein 69a-like n=1 Tax=Bacillus rossius redtenbacheri TaxID=93214 RepID=UPI002FDE6347
MRPISVLQAAILLAGLAGSAVGMTGRALEKAKEVDAKCRAETGAGEGSFGKFVAGAIEVDDQVFKCFIKCIMNELAALDHAGTFNLEEELLNVPPEVKEEGHRIVTACQHTKGADPCDTAYQLHKCYHDANPELYNRVLSVWDFNAGVS